MLILMCPKEYLDCYGHPSHTLKCLNTTALDNITYNTKITLNIKPNGIIDSELTAFSKLFFGLKTRSVQIQGHHFEQYCFII